MANHLSAKKRIRQTAKKKIYNHYFAKTMRNSIKNFRAIDDKVLAQESINKISSSIDKLVTKGIIHKNKAANLKSKLVKKVNKMQ